MIEVDVWVRGTNHATTHPIPFLDESPDRWTDREVRTLLSEMLLALEREKNPGGDPPPISLRGFSWIVSPYQGGVLLHLEMQMGSASAGPIGIDERRLSSMIDQVMKHPDDPDRVH